MDENVGVQSLERQKKQERERVPYDQLVARVEELESGVGELLDMILDMAGKIDGT